MTIKAALLDAPAAGGNGVFLRVEELAGEAALTDRHVLAITACDLPPGKYRWVPDTNPKNAFGGAFWPISYLDRLAHDRIEVIRAEARAGARKLIVVERRGRK